MVVGGDSHRISRRCGTQLASQAIDSDVAIER